MTGHEDQGMPDDTSVLPDEILIYIFKHLALETLLECENVCRRWRKLSRDVCLWKRITIIYSGKPGRSEISARNLDIIGTHYEYIYQLKVQYVYSYPFIKTLIQRCSNLTSLELVMCRLAKEFVSDILKWPNLKKLNLKNSLVLGTYADLLIPFHQFKDLHYLALSDFGLSSINCNSLLQCQYLSHIFIEKIKNLNLEYVTKLILSKQEILVALHIYGESSIDNKCLQLLSKCLHLKDLAIIRCQNLTDDGLLPLAHLKCIEHLQLWNNSNFTERNLLRTLSSPALISMQSLSLSRICNVSPVIVDVISKYYKNLKFLAIYQCPKIINTDYEKQLTSKFRNIDVVLY